MKTSSSQFLSIILHIFIILYFIIQFISLYPVNNRESSGQGGWFSLRTSSAVFLQETFWRIPAKLSSTQLRRMAASLNQQEKEEREEERELHPGVPGEQSPSEHRAKALRALLSARKKKAGLVSPEGRVSLLTSWFHSCGCEGWEGVWG